jgi:hypothetical protein
MNGKPPALRAKIRNPKKIRMTGDRIIAVTADIASICGFPLPSQKVHFPAPAKIRDNMAAHLNCQESGQGRANQKVGCGERATTETRRGSADVCSPVALSVGTHHDVFGFSRDFEFPIRSVMIHYL